MRKAGSSFGLVVFAGVVGLILAKAAASPAIAIVAGVFVVAGVITYFAADTEQLALFAVGVLALTITWNGVRIGGSGGNTTGVSGGALGDATLVLAALAVIVYVVSKRRSLPLPPWLFAAGLGCFLAMVLVIISPPAIDLLNRAEVTQATLAQQGAGGTLGRLQPISTATDAVTFIEFELALVVIPILMAAVGTTPRRCRLLIDLFVAGAVINGFVGVLGRAGINISPTPTTQNRAAGLTIHPNYLALTCVIALPLVMLWFGRSRRFNVAGLIGLAGLLGGVFVSGSRAGTAAAVIAVVATVALLPTLRARLPYVIPLGGMALVAILLFTSVGRSILHQLRLGGSSSSSSTSGSNYQRSIVNHVAWVQFKSRPLGGVGFGIMPGPHDIFLELLAAGGVIAMASFLTFIGGLAAALRRALSGPLREEAIACGIAIFAWLANGAFDNQVADKYLYLVPGLLFAIGRATWLLQTASPQPPVVAATPRPALAPSRVLPAGLR